MSRVIDGGIGPWVLSADGAGLVRAQNPPLGGWPRQSGSWAREEEIPVKPGKRHRVTLIGESVARGFLLDPVVSLADLLRGSFDRAGRGDDLELVDFAVNNLSPQNALRLCRAAVELGSAAVVLYVGNNFLRSTPWLEPDTRSATAKTLENQGYAGYLAARREALASLARRFRREAAEIGAATGVRLVVVVPAVNLLDWNSPWVVPTWLPEEDMTRWVSVQRRLAALPGEDLEAAFDLAGRLVELDGGTTPRPMEIVGQCLVRRGQEDEGLAMLGRAVSVGGDPANYDRRCPPDVAAELRLLGGLPGCRLVDVPARSRARFGSAAFGRQTFLDYCHHTVESLRLVADDVAGEVLASVGLSGAPGPAPVEPPSKELAEGYLLSALHNQHWGQPAEIVEHWIAEAVRTHPASVESLATYFATSVPAAEFWLSGGLRTGGSERMYWFLKNFSHLAVLDAEFAERALRVLDEDGREHLRRALDGVRDRLRVEASDGVNLLEPFWRERTGPPQPATVFTGERDPVSRYGFVASGEEPISLDVVLTAGPGLPDGRFELALNGRACYSAPVTADWRSHRVILPAAMLRAGANELAFAWPAAARTRQSLSSAVSAFGTGPESLDLVRLARMRLSATS